MQRGKRKSPFVGASEVIDSNAAPILYQRYTSLTDILVDGSAPPPPESAPLKKKPKREKVKKPKIEGEGSVGQQVKQQKQPKNPKGPRKLEPEERVSGPGNASEALKIREALGFVAATPQEIAEAEAAAQRASRPTFAFGFGVGGGASPAAPTPALGAGPAKAPVQKSGDSSSDESSGSESEDDAKEHGSDSKGEANGVEGASSGSSESDDDSSDDSSESDDEDAIGRPAQPDSAQPSPPQRAQQQGQQAAAPAPRAQQAQQAAAAPPVDDEDGEFVPRRVYVGGMPFSYSEDQVHEYWSYCGEIESMDCMTFPDTGRFRGIVFVTFTTQEGYEAALACDGEPCDGQTLKVQKCKWSPKERAARDKQRAAQQAQQAPMQPSYARTPPQQQQQQVSPGPSTLNGSGAFGTKAAAGPSAGKLPFQSPAPKTEGYNVAYVGNIAFEADDKELEQLFEGYNVTKVRLHTDKDTGRSKGFAHIHFRDAESLDRAFALSGTQLHGRKIKMGYAQPKKEQTAAV